MTKRNLGVDLLRIVSMGMVLVLHLLLNSGALGAFAPFTLPYYTVWMMEILAYGAVDVFAMISGYVGAGRRVRYANLAYLWCTAVVLGLAVTLWFRFTRPLEYNVTPDSRFSPLIRALFPVFTCQYWFLNAYFLMFLFLPLINAGLEALSGRRLFAILGVLLLAVCGLNVAGYDDPLRVAHGYSAIWLLLLYVLGAAIRRSEALHRIPKSVLLIGYLFFSLVTFASRWLLDLYTFRTRGQIERDDYLVRYVSPTVVAAAVCLLLFFAKLRIGKAAGAAIGFFAPSAFSVYLIHEHPIFRALIMQKYFTDLTQRSPLGLVCRVLMYAAVLFVFCAAVDLVRRGLFRLCRVKPLLQKAEDAAQRVGRRFSRRFGQKGEEKV